MMGSRALKYEPLKDSYQFLHPTFSTYMKIGVEEIGRIYSIDWLVMKDLNRNFFILS